MTTTQRGSVGHADGPYATFASLPIDVPATLVVFGHLTDQEQRNMSERYHNALRDLLSAGGATPHSVEAAIALAQQWFSRYYVFPNMGLAACFFDDRDDARRVLTSAVLTSALRMVRYDAPVRDGFFHILWRHLLDRDVKALSKFIARHCGLRWSSRDDARVEAYLKSLDSAQRVAYIAAQGPLLVTGLGDDLPTVAEPKCGALTVKVKARLMGTTYGALRKQLSRIDLQLARIAPRLADDAEETEL
jgi:hypothetical protein